MKLKASSVLFLAYMLLPNASYCAAQEASASSDALISHARLQQLWAEGTPPMKMRAEIYVAGADGTPAQGDYTLDWVSPSQWREQIHFANYERLRVRDAKGYWQNAVGLRSHPKGCIGLFTGQPHVFLLPGIR